ncbi:MAG: restriction endonuclease subunit S [Rectinemataceae bacterium]
MKIPAGYKQTEVGVIPKDWEAKPLLSIVDIAKGQVDPRTKPYSEMILVAPDHVQRETGVLIEKRTASEQNAISGKYLFNPGNVVYSKIRPYLRKAILADFPGLCSADMYPLVPVDGTIPGFVLAIILGHDFSTYAESVSIRSGMPKINRAELAEYVLPLPPLPEQRAIAAALSDVDALIAKIEALIAKKRDLKQAAMQELLTGKRRLPGFSGEWEVKRLGELVSSLQYGSSAKSHASGTVPVLRMGNLQDGKIDWTDLVFSSNHEEIERYLLKSGDLLFNRTNTVDLVGKTSLFNSNRPAIFAGYLIRIACDLAKADPGYLNSDLVYPA